MKATLERSHDLAKLESKLKVYYFLRELGVKAAIPASTETFIEYMEVISEITIAATESLTGSDC